MPGNPDKILKTFSSNLISKGSRRLKNLIHPNVLKIKKNHDYFLTKNRNQGIPFNSIYLIFSKHDMCFVSRK